jgi:dephospho-CoA kinase
MKLCGLTGGVGMGKSTAAGFFLRQGAKVVDTDEIARQLVEPGQPALLEIRDTFGAAVFNPAGGLRRDKLAELVFANDDARQKLEIILHPMIRAAWLMQVEQWRQEGCALALVVIPLLFETQAETHFEKIICVACSAATQSDRLTGRGWSPEHLSQRIAAQWPIEQKIARSHHVIWTEGTLTAHELQVARMVGRL